MNPRIFWVFLWFLSASTAFCLDLEVQSKVSNLYWAIDRTDTASDRIYKGSDLFWTLEGSLTQDLGDGLVFKGGVENDPVLRWRAFSRWHVTLENLTLEFTPFLGAFNSTQKWFNPGLEASVEYTWPGVMFARGGFLTTFAPVSKTGDYYLSAQSASLGALLENGIVSFTIEDKSATFQAKTTQTTVDTSTKYWLDTEIFLKNFPLRWAIITGYQITGRRYIAAAEVSTPLHSALLGARFAWDFGAGTQAYWQAESAFFNVGWDSTVMELPSTALVFQTVAGVRYHW